MFDPGRIAFRRLSLPFVAAMAWVIATGAPIWAGPLTRTVALTGDLAPGTMDEELVRFSTPAINAAGRVAFQGFISCCNSDADENQGIWSEGQGQLQLVALAGDAAPGTNGAFTSFVPPAINSAGKTLFFAQLSGASISSLNDRGIWTGAAPNDLEVVVRRGDAAPGAPAGAQFLVTYVPPPLLNSAGATAFLDGIAGGGAVDLNDEGLWTGGPDGLKLAVREGSHLDGSSQALEWSNLKGPALNDAGQVAFYAAPRGAIGEDSPEGIYVGTPGDLGPVAQSGDPAVAAGVGFTFDRFYGPVALNSGGRTAFLASVRPQNVHTISDLGLWSEGSGELTLLARRGEAAPGALKGEVFATFGSPVLNKAGHVALFAQLGGPDVNNSNDSSIGVERPSGLELVAREGGAAPGASAGVVFSGLQPFSNPSMNAVGQILFAARLAGDGVDSTNDLGLWATDLDGTQTLIAREGDSLEVSPGNYRTISTLTFIGNTLDTTLVQATGNEDGRRSGFNDRGQVAFHASFSDGTSGIFVSDLVAVPEPGAGWSILMMVAFFGKKFQRRTAIGRGF